MFRATMGPSSGGITVSMRLLVLVTLCGWLSGMQGGVPLGVGDCLVYRVECHSVWVIVWYAGWSATRCGWLSGMQGGVPLGVGDCLVCRMEWKENGVGVFSTVGRKCWESKEWIPRGHRNVILSIPGDIWAANNTYVHCWSSPGVARFPTRLHVDCVSVRHQLQRPCQEN